ncbi:MAG: hypothetical protein JXR07_13055 [Reichenbachiella sp.]
MLSEKQKDAITEIVNIGVGKGSATLSQMLNEEIILNVPYANVISFDKVLLEFEDLHVKQVHAVEMQFRGEYQGLANVILSTDSASHLAAVLTGLSTDSPDLIQMKDGVITEVGNIILNAVMGSFGNILAVPFEYNIPQSFEGDISDLYHHLDQEKYSQVLICRTNFTIKDRNIEGEILIMYEIGSFNKLKDLLDTMID